MKLFQIFIFSTCISLLAACTESTINASTYETMNNSYKSILSSLPNEEKQPFKRAYNSIVFSHQNHVAFREKGDTREIIQKRLERKIGGMNVSMILEEYKKLSKKKALWDIQRIEKDIAEVNDSKKQLSLVTIDKYKLYMEKDARLQRMFLDMIIRNDSKYKLTGVTFTIRVGSFYSDTILPQKRSIYINLSEELKQGQETFKKIDLGYPSSHRYLPKDPMLSEYTTSRISGSDVDMQFTIYPTLAILEKRLTSKKDEFKKKFGTD